MFASGSQPGEIFFQSEPAGTLTILSSCFCSYGLMLSMISAPLIFVSLFFNFIWIELLVLIRSPLQIANIDMIYIMWIIYNMDIYIYIYIYIHKFSLEYRSYKYPRSLIRSSLNYQARLFHFVCCKGLSVYDRDINRAVFCKFWKSIGNWLKSRKYC